MRLLTRSDFDGLACAVLLKEMGVIDSLKFVHPKDIQDGLVEVTPNDVLANIPYVKGCGLWFDHHASEQLRLGEFEFEGDWRIADSAAHVVYDYYGGDFGRLHDFKSMVEAVDRVDSAKLTLDDVLNPHGWVLLGFVMDPRTGLGRFRDFKISNYELMEKLIDLCRIKRIEEILGDEDVLERVKLYCEQDALFREMVKKYTRIEDNIIVTDLRGVETIYAGNRFLIYSLYPEQSISMWIVDGRAKLNCAIAVGHSIFNRSSNVNVGELLLKYNGGGHDKVGTCQVPYGDSDKVIEELITQMKGV